jgi:hypothetical protein
MKEYLMSSENVALYGECRAFLTCIKENHGGIFRLVVFSSLLDAEKKLKAFKQQELNPRTKSKSSHVFVRQDAVSNNGKMVNQLKETFSSNFEFLKTRDLSDETDLDRQGSQQLQTLGTDDAPTTNIGSSSFSIKLKSKNKMNSCCDLIDLFFRRFSCSNWVILRWR